MRKAENDRAKNKLRIIIYYSCYTSRQGLALAVRPAKYDYIRGERAQMSIAAIITLSITIAGFVGGIIAALVKLGAIVGRLMERLESNEKRDSEERAKIEANFSELYGRMNATECEVKSQGTAINSLVATCSRIETKLDRVIEARG